MLVMATIWGSGQLELRSVAGVVTVETYNAHRHHKYGAHDDTEEDACIHKVSLEGGPLVLEATRPKQASECGLRRPARVRRMLD